MVFDHPFFAVTEADGSFEIKGVPAGDPDLIVWQEKVGFVTPGRREGLEPSRSSRARRPTSGDVKLVPK